ncbi:hypothetical protein GGX14DRAFT_597170 [Mycena pura]|uniref:Uncharacterized protein n=1 Tax=Mycena pura TaxID=153505 RepID=A0AAD6UW86_9AGAR|nr:hypothetical protein GGX14DRAFT_597170 [Mycena pura]
MSLPVSGDLLSLEFRRFRWPALLHFAVTEHAPATFIPIPELVAHMPALRDLAVLFTADLTRMICSRRSHWADGSLPIARYNFRDPWELHLLAMRDLQHSSKPLDYDNSPTAVLNSLLTSTGPAPTEDRQPTRPTCSCASPQVCALSLTDGSATAPQHLTCGKRVIAAFCSILRSRNCRATSLKGVP